ncbi:protein kinase domain-containing protein [Yinghuangia aomiensis]
MRKASSTATSNPRTSSSTPGAAKSGRNSPTSASPGSSTRRAAPARPASSRTPDYLAPEIIEGLQPTAAVDVYALGTVLYELLTGWTPFGGGHPGAVLRRHVTEPGCPASRGCPHRSPEVLAACLSKAPAARLTAREVGERLRAALPALAGLPRFDVPAPDGGHPDGRAHRGETPPPLPAGVVPLVSGTEPDSSRDTHTNLARPTFPAPPITPRGTAPRTASAAAAPSPPRRSCWSWPRAARSAGGTAAAATTRRPSSRSTTPCRRAPAPASTARRATPRSPPTPPRTPRRRPRACRRGRAGRVCRCRRCS